MAPIDVHEGLTCIDPAGYTVVRSDKPFDWSETPASFDFELVVQDERVAELQMRPTLIRVAEVSVPTDCSPVEFEPLHVELGRDSFKLDFQVLS